MQSRSCCRIQSRGGEARGPGSWGTCLWTPWVEEERERRQGWGQWGSSGLHPSREQSICREACVSIQRPWTLLWGQGNIHKCLCAWKEDFSSYECLGPLPSSQGTRKNLFAEAHQQILEGGLEVRFGLSTSQLWNCRQGM